MYDEINQNKFVLDCERYIEENVAAPYIAFYLARGYSLDVLGTSSLKQHFNSAADVFNIYFENTDKVITDIKQALLWILICILYHSPLYHLFLDPNDTHPIKTLVQGNFVIVLELKPQLQHLACYIF